MTTTARPTTTGPTDTTAILTGGKRGIRPRTRRGGSCFPRHAAYFVNSV